MENKNKGKVIVIIILVLIVLGLSGYIVYDKVYLAGANNEVKEKDNVVPTPKKTTTSISGSYVYDGPYNEELTAHLEIKLNEDNTFILYEGVTDAVAYKGTYYLNGSKLILHAIESDGFQSDSSRDSVSTDTFECTYDSNDNTININKINQYWDNPDTHKVERNVYTDFDGKKLTQTNNLEHIDNEKLFGN